MDKVQSILEEAEDDVNIDYDTHQALMYIATALHEASDVELDKAEGYFDEILNEYKDEII